MAHNDTVFAQVLKLVPRQEFESLARKHKSGRMSRSMTRWGQFVAMGMAQLTGRCSLRDIVSNLAAPSCKLYHLGVGVVTRSSLARVNAEKPWEMYEELHGRLLGRCQAKAPGHGYRFKAKLGSSAESVGRTEVLVRPTASRVLAAVKARRSAPPPLRGADGLDAGCAHERPGSCLTRTHSRRPEARRRGAGAGAQAQPLAPAQASGEAHRRAAGPACGAGASQPAHGSRLPAQGGLSIAVGLRVAVLGRPVPRPLVHPDDALAARPDEGGCPHGCARTAT